ncbi:tetratricopeptide repeat protein [Streptomyces sp. NPDC051214]|uniref:ATP-binding protein n=1 Tax=Streptomyces sp. NPDC051214 TaxID=3155282 RepID=UPI00344870AB
MIRPEGARNGDHVEFKGGIIGPVLGSGNMENIFNFSDVRTPSPRALESLPVGPVRLVGREALAGELLSLLSPERPTKTPTEAVVVSSVSGLAGVGKTALALYVAHVARDKQWFPGGTIFVDLHGYDPNGSIAADRVLAPLIRALGVPDNEIPGSYEGRIGVYLSRLADLADQGLSVLLVLDNVSSASQVTPLLPGRPGHRVIVTSRHTLAELPARLIDIETLALQDAISLIAQSLADARPSDSRPQEEAEKLQELAKLCGCLPLALQIAAALLKAEPRRPVADLLEDLQDINSRLRTLRYDDGEGRSMAVKAAFDLSYDRLKPEQARIFRLMSLCPGQEVSLEAAAALVGESEREVRPLVAGLAQAHLVEPLAVGRWRLHDLIHLYGKELCQRVDAEVDISDALDRLIRHYQITAHEADDALDMLRKNNGPRRFNSPQEALSWLDQERATIMACIDVAKERDPEAAWALILHSGKYLSQRHYFDDVISNVQTSIEIASSQGWSNREAFATERLGSFLHAISAHEDAIQAYRRAAEILAEVGDRHREGHCLSGLGDALNSAWRYDEGIVAKRRAVDIFRENGDRDCEADALNSLGRSLSSHGKWRNGEALESHRAALKIFREIRKRRGEAVSRDYIGVLMMDAKRYDEALEMHREALDIFREIGRRDDEMVALSFSGDALSGAGRNAAAVVAYKQALSIARELGRRGNEGHYLESLGGSFRSLRLFQESLDSYSQALDICRETKNLHREAHILASLADSFDGLGQHAEAVAARRRAGDLFAATGVRSREARGQG